MNAMEVRYIVGELQDIRLHQDRSARECKGRATRGPQDERDDNRDLATLAEWRCQAITKAITILTQDNR